MKYAFKEYQNIKDTHSKLEGVKYNKMSIQPYLRSKFFRNNERNLLYALRSNCHTSKFNFKKMYRDGLQCRFGCNAIETQVHTFTQCKTLLQEAKLEQTFLNFNDIFGNTCAQKKIIEKFVIIEQTRNELKEKLLPGGEAARTT